MTSNIPTAVSLSVEPKLALIDDKLRITISGLNPHQDITVHVRTVNDDGCAYTSYGCFKASEEGKVDISRDECIQGTYKGKLHAHGENRILRY